MVNEITKQLRKMRRNQTEAEEAFWQIIKNTQLGVRFVRQHPIFYSQGKKVYKFIADFCCRKLKIVIEIDGPIHNKQKKYDAMRESMLKDMGYIILRFNNNEVINHPEEVMKKTSIILNRLLY